MGERPKEGTREGRWPASFWCIWRAIGLPWNALRLLLDPFGEPLHPFDTIWAAMELIPGTVELTQEELPGTSELIK